jgi:tol-pal system protein YbgF
MNHIRWSSFLFSCLAFSACITPAQVDLIEREQRYLRSEIAALRTDIEGVRAGLADTRANLDQTRRVASAANEKADESRFQVDKKLGLTTRDGDQKIKEIESRLARLTDDLRAQSALLKARDEELKALREAMQAKAEKEAAPTAVATVTAPARGDSEAARREYEEALRIVDRRDYRAAIQRLKEFLKKYPNTEFSDNAQYWIGECHYALREFDLAIIEFDAVRSKYPNGAKVPAALLKQAFAFAELGSKVEARLILQELISRYPQSEEASRAKQKLKTLGA